MKLRMSRPNLWRQRSEDIMSVSQADQAMLYASYAEHCVKVAKALPNRESRIVHREMAAEWLKLAGQAATSDLARDAQPAEQATRQVR